MAFKRVASAADVQPGEVRVFAVNGDSIAIANVEGRFFALDNVCTHDGGPLGEGMLFGDQVECPRHGARFQVETGRVMAFPAVLPVRTYPTRVSGEDLEVDI
jgi:3-phenylpropionate/trans-cinnamate dioxygenase ferredoxin subunit